MASRRDHAVKSRVFAQAWKSVATFLKSCSKKEQSKLRSDSYDMTNEFVRRLGTEINRSRHAIAPRWFLKHHGSSHWVILLGTKAGRHEHVIDFRFRKFDRKSPWPLVESVEDYRARVRAL